MYSLYLQYKFILQTNKIGKFCIHLQNLYNIYIFFLVANVYYICYFLYVYNISFQSKHKNIRKRKKKKEKEKTKNKNKAQIKLRKKNVTNKNSRYNLENNPS